VIGGIDFVTGQWVEVSHATMHQSEYAFLPEAIP